MYAYNSVNGWKMVQSFSQNYSSNFGNSLTMLSDASFFAVGAPSFYGNVGYVFVYIKSSQNTWILQQTITSPVPNSVDFGRSVSFNLNSVNQKLQLIIGSSAQYKVFIYNYDPIQQEWGNYHVINPVNAFAPNFGTNVGLTNKYAFVSNPILNSLFVYEYKVSSSTWLPYQTISVVAGVFLLMTVG